MTLEEKAANLSHPEIVSLLLAHNELSSSFKELSSSYQKLETKLQSTEQQLSWFKKQIFGQKSEKREYVVDPRQLNLGELVASPTSQGQVAKQEVSSYQRGKAKKQPLEGSLEDSGLRFGPDVPMKEILLPCTEIDELEPSQYTEITREHTYQLAQQPAAYTVLKFIRRVVKLKENSIIISTPAPRSVIEKSFAEVSFIVGLLIDKMQYHLPLYRQHQRLENAGIKLSRATLTNLFHRAAELLLPIYKAQFSSILSSKVLCMDETPIKAARTHSGKMKTSYYWPIYGEQNEICFEWRESREHRHVKEILQGYNGILLSDGYQAYDTYSAQTLGCTLAQCWNHVRRDFVEALPYEPELAQKAIEFIGLLYEQEELIKAKKLNEKNKLLHRVEKSKPIVETFFKWLSNTLGEKALLPTNLFTKAANYALKREEPLKVFLQYPEVQLDTNHEEREIRSIAMGRKNWNFCWTEVGAVYVGLIQSLVRTCILHEINPQQYLIDVLQRIDVTPQKDVALLTPRLWKSHFAENKFVSWLDFPE